MPRFIAIIQADPEKVGIVLARVHDLSRHLLHRRKVSRYRCVFSRLGASSRIDCKQVHILIATRIFDIEDVLAVFGPCVAVQWTLAVGERPRFLKRLSKFFDPDVHNALIRLHEGDELSIGAQLTSGDLRISEKELPVEQIDIRLCCRRV